MSVETTLDPDLLADGSREPVARRLVVAWQHPTDRGIYPIALLDTESGRYRFRYLARALDVPEFRPLLGFPDTRRVYVSGSLFPLFKQRVMNRRRRDYGRFIDSLDLPVDATPWEQLTRSGGQRDGDTIQLFPVPLVSPDGSTSCRFLVHGVRHIEKQDSTVQERIDSLVEPEELLLIDEPENPKNSRAIQIATTEGRVLGWVPNLLLDYAHTIREYAPVSVVAEHANSSSVPYHFRVIARIDGAVPPEYRPFSGPGWETLAG